MKTKTEVTKKSNAVKRVSKKAIQVNTAKKKERIAYNSMINTNSEAKEYQKTFKGVRTVLLGGKADKEIKLTPIEAQLLNATKSNKHEKLFKYIIANGKSEADYTRKDGVKVKYSHFTVWSVLGVLRTIANSDTLLRELEYKF